MLKIGYCDGKRVDIKEYDPELHENKIKCEEGHILVAKRGEVKIHHFSHRAGEGSKCTSSEGKLTGIYFGKVGYFPIV